MAEDSDIAKDFKKAQRRLAFGSLIIGLIGLFCAYQAAGWWLVGAILLTQYANNLTLAHQRLTTSEGMAAHMMGKMMSGWARKK